MNSPQNKIVNLYLNEKLEGDLFVETTDVTNVLTEVNENEDDWLRNKPSCTNTDSIDSGYLNDLNFLSTKDSDTCTSDIGLDFVLIDGKKEPNLRNCSLTDKSSDLNLTDSFLNLIPLNEVSLHKSDSKCDILLNGISSNNSNKEIVLNKCRPIWDTPNIVNRENDCELDSNMDYCDLNLLPFSLETSDQNSNAVSTKETLVKKNVHNLFSFNNVRNNRSIANSVLLTEQNRRNKMLPGIVPDIKALTADKAVTSKRPSILKLSKIKSSEPDNVIVANLNISNKSSPDESDTVLELCDSDSVQVLDFNFRILPENLEECRLTYTVPNDSALALNEEKTSLLRKNRISAINNITGSVAIVSNSTTNSKPKTKIIIKTKKGDEKYEGNTADLMETTSTYRKSQMPQTPIEGEHIVTAVKTAASVVEKRRHTNSANLEMEDGLVKEMLSALGVTDDMLYSMITNLGLRMWVCPELECKRIFCRLNTLKSHILSHYGLKPFKCDFPGCPWSFYTLFKLKRHRETHLKRKDFVCTVPDCNRTFTTIYNLNTHLKLHERPARLKCLVRTCNNKFQTRRAMEAHLKTHEISVAPYRCTHQGCDKLYFSFSALIAHSRSHQHREDELRCQWENCGRLFDKPCRLKAHMRQHTGDKPYVCRFKDCKWAFSSSSKLKRHQYKHNNERKFRCTIGDCTKAFMRSEHLREHTFTHIAQKTFQCSVCGEKCSAKATLYVHKKKFHPNESRKKADNSNVSQQIEKTESNKAVERCDENKMLNLPILDVLPQSNNEYVNSTQQKFLIAILTEEKHSHTVIATDTSPLSLTDVNGKEYKLSISDLSTMNQLVTISSEIEHVTAEMSNGKNNCDIMRSSATTHIPYEDMLKQNEQLIINSSTIAKVFEEFPDVSTVTDMTSDVISGATVNPNSEHTICMSNFILQDEKLESSNVENKAEYILLLNTEADSSFPQSTINLKDLD